jgi:hypothetical protein
MLRRDGVTVWLTSVVASDEMSSPMDVSPSLAVFSIEEDAMARLVQLSGCCREGR